MNRWTMKRWLTLPALLLAGLMWTGAARADAPALAPDDDEDEVTMEWIDNDGAMLDVDDEIGDDLLAGGGGEFDGPGGFSAPAGPRSRDRMEKRIVMRRDGAGMRGGRGGGMRMHAGMAQALGLTDAQKAKMADVHEAHERRMIAVRSGLAEARLDLRKATRADAPNQAQIDATIDRMAKLRAEAQKSRIATRLAARGVLTPEQKKQLLDGGGRGGHRGGGPGMGMGMKHRGPGGGRHGAN